MTPDDLAAIRARHVPVAGLREDEGHLFEPATFCRHCVTLWPCDAFALLAEVDRLERACADAFIRGRERERATIRAAVEGVPDCPLTRYQSCSPYHLHKWEVLAAINGGGE